MSAESKPEILDKRNEDTAANLGFKATLFKAADIKKDMTYGRTMAYSR